MNRLKPVALSASHRPVLLDGETIHRMQGHVAIYNGDSVSQFDDGVAYVTSQRVMWVSHDLAHAFAIPLSDINHADDSAGSVSFFNVRASYKVSMLIEGGGMIRFSFREGGRDLFLEKLVHVLQLADRNRRLDRIKVETDRRDAEFDTRKAGIGGIIRSKRNEGLRKKEEVRVAFQDLDSLMAKANDMVKLATRLAALQGKEQTSSSSSPGDDGGPSQDVLHQYMHDLGIQSPVTRATAGNRFLVELARELADFAVKALAESHAGMVGLPDVYCLFNRARGTELISPEDLVNACKLFEALKLPVRLRTFESGVLAVEGVGHSDAELSKRVSDLARRIGSLTALDVSQAEGVSILVALETLMSAEQHEVLCRDDAAEGLVFYPNAFVT